MALWVSGTAMGFRVKLDHKVGCLTLLKERDRKVGVLDGSELDEYLDDV